MKILWLIKGLGLGGAENTLVTMLPIMTSRGHEIEVAYFLPGKNAMVNHFDQAGIPVHCLEQKHGWDLRAFFRLRRLLKRIEPDILHCHLPYAGLAASVVRIFTHVPLVIYTEHGQIDLYGRRATTVHRWSLKKMDGIIGISDAVTKSVDVHVKLDSGTPMRTIPNGVNVTESSADENECMRGQLGISNGDRVVVSVANLRAEKRHEDLLHAAKAVLRTLPNTKFVLVGDGPRRPCLEQLVSQLGIANNVIFTGQTKLATKITACADVFAITSEYEGLGVAILEAMCLNVPVVATRVGGIPEIIDDEVNGLLVEPHSPESIAKKIVRLLTDPALSRRLSSIAKQNVGKNFSAERMTEETAQFYETLIQSDLK